ncbi:hypothetical protein IFM89_012130 [Coptis chinensis]|uniref:Dirigent protein n=1 Tax=Coptis chinensis TaxID=261450 RepID=A0A835IVU7_9MAGN|nr:hypothetical protein IFM89_012130 [Coptis chinensis]
MASALTNFFNLLVLSTILIIKNGENSEWISETKLLGQMKEKFSHLHFYFHDTISGGKPSAKQIAGPKVPGFGTMMITDDPLTEGLELTSKLVGKAQGIYASAAQKESGLLMVLNYAFMEGKYNGSTSSNKGDVNCWREELLSQLFGEEFCTSSNKGDVNCWRDWAFQVRSWVCTCKDYLV